MGVIDIVNGRLYETLPVEEIEQIRNEAYNQGREDVIDEIYMKAKTKMDLLKQQTQGRRNGKTHAMYCIQALEFMREVVNELMEQKNND